MSIHHSHSAGSVATGVGGALGGVGQAVAAAWMLSRQDAGRQDAENVAAAEGARAGVLRSTVHGLREQLAQERHDHREAVLDLQADADFFRAENIKMTARMRQLEDAVVQLDAQRRTLAAALVEARAA